MTRDRESLYLHSGAGVVAKYIDQADCDRPFPIWQFWTLSHSHHGSRSFAVTPDRLPSGAEGFAIVVPINSQQVLLFAVSSDKFAKLSILNKYLLIKYRRF
jgi:hypothetical protein